MSEEEYSHYVEALVTGILEKPKNIDQQDAEYWREISSNTYNFDRGKKIFTNEYKVKIIQFFFFTNDQSKQHF